MAAACGAISFSAKSLALSRIMSALSPRSKSRKRGALGIMGSGRQKGRAGSLGGFMRHVQRRDAWFRPGAALQDRHHERAGSRGPRNKRERVRSTPTNTALRAYRDVVAI